ncbi:MAG TPA: alpha/beta hydrolase [Abditibacterium sp.]|jgi:pimeloyl-ACP methyl ester carboxylesterase
MLKITQISPSTKISYRHAGECESPTLVFLHAFPLSSAMWERQIEEFSSDYEVFAPDFRGIAQTTPFSDKPSIQTLADDLALWLEKLDLYGPITLCGLSMGGYVALEFARQFPQFLGRLILADTRADTDSADAKKGRGEMIEFAKNNAGRAVAQKMLPKLLGATTQRENLRVAQTVKAIASANSGENLAKIIAALRDRRDSGDVLPQIAVPTLVIGGNEDGISPTDVMAQMADQIPRARHVSIEGAGHLSSLEKPEEFNRELRKFLEEIK